MTKSKKIMIGALPFAGTYRIVCSILWNCKQ